MDDPWAWLARRPGRISEAPRYRHSNYAGKGQYGPHLCIIALIFILWVIDFSVFDNRIRSSTLSLEVVMDIDSPRQPGFYEGRQEDCEDALASAFDELVATQDKPFLDLKKIVGELTPDAVAVGWGCSEILEALHKLAMDHQRKLGNVHAQFAAAFYADGGHSKH